MNKHVILSLLFVCALSPVFAGIDFDNLTLDEALAKAQKENKLVFIDVYAEWCGPCKYLAKEVFTDDELGQFMNQHYVSVQLDGERDDGLGLMRKFNLTAYPTMLFMSADGELLKKIVGVVSATEIQNKGKGVRFPETTKIYQLEKQYSAGKRDKAFMKSYIREMIIEEKDTEAVLTEYMKKYPELNLEDEGEFIIFTMAIADRESAYIQDFMKRAEHYSTVHGELCETKMEMILISIMSEAVEQKNKSLITDQMDWLYPAYKAVFGEQAHDKEKLQELMLSNYERAM